MKFALAYPARCMPRPLSPRDLYTSPRGLTGSEAAFAGYAMGLAELGHSVDAFANVPEPCRHWGVYWEHSDRFPQSPDYDAVVSFMAPDPLAACDPRVFRVQVEQCSDFGNYPPGWEELPDYFCALSRTHARELSSQSRFPHDRYRLLPNGVDLGEFEPIPKTPGRCVWASSHDRGLHHLLELWPEVRRRAPRASLRIFYDDAGLRAFAGREEEPQHPRWWRELGRRARYSLEVLERLREGYGVEFFGSVVLEAASAGCVPVLCLSDSFGELWGEVCPAVRPPFAGKNREAYVDLLCSVLEKGDARQAAAKRCRSAAASYAWDRLSRNLEAFLATRGESGLEKAL